jgi:hypothetical protein
VGGLDKTHTLEQYRQLLDSPNLRRVFRITDGGDSGVLSQVASVVERTTRFRFFKITISQGIVIDPRHPEEATVFAAVVNARELDILRDRLNRALPDRVEESPAEPAVVTQLADIGQVRAADASPVGDVLIPQEGVALRAHLAAENEDAPAHVAVAAAHPAGPTPEQFRSAPVGELVARQSGDTEGTPARKSSGVGPGASANDARGDAPAASERTPPLGDGRGALVEAPAKARREKSGEILVVLVWVSRTPQG